MRWWRRREAAHRERPHRPLFADQKKWGVNLSTRMKALVLLGSALIIANVLLFLYLLDYLSVARDQRLTDQKQLACLLVQDTPAGNALADEIRAKYRCPAYSNRHVPPTPSPSTTTRTRTVAPNHPAASASATPGAQRPPAGSSTPPRAAQSRSGPRATSASVVAGGTRTVVRTHTVPASSPRPSPSSTGLLPPPVADPICRLLPATCGLVGG